MERIWSLIKAFVLVSAFLATFTQISAEEFMDGDFAFNFSLNDELLSDDIFLWEEGDDLFEMTSSLSNNYQSEDNVSSDLPKEEISGSMASTVKPSSNLEENNSVVGSFEFFISPISGEKYEIIKDPINETKKYRDHSNMVYDTIDQIFNSEIEMLSISPNLLKLDQKLRNLIESRDTNDTVPVIIVFVEQPAHNVSIEVQAMYEPIFEEITAPAKAVYERIEPMMTAADEDADVIALEQELLTVEEKDLLNETGVKLKQEKMLMRRDILEISAPLVDEIQTPVIEKIKTHGGEVGYNGTIFNSIAARVPVSYLEELSRDPSIARIAYEQTYIVTLDTSNEAIYADTWWNQGYTGRGWAAAVIDTGIDVAHPNLENNVVGSEVFLDSGMNDAKYNEPKPPITDDLNGHGTHCAGIIASYHPTNRGTAYEGALINAKAGFNGTDGRGHLYDSDIKAAADWSTYIGADVISCSFGFNHGADANGVLCQYMDEVTFIYNVPFVVAAGNINPWDPANTTYVTSPGSAYNVVTVGNVDNRNSETRSDDEMNPSSCIGPTGDYIGRRKPDISAPGTEIFSCNNKWETQNDFRLGTGTSMATPHVAGSILLILDFKGMNWNAEALKALLLNSASYMGTGPNYYSGYGYIDMKNAYIHRGDVFVGSLEDKPEGTAEKYFKGPVYSGYKATLVWNRHYPNFLVISDLDLFMYDESNGGLIYKSESGNENVEQVKSGSSYSSAIIKIEPWNYPSGLTSERYALATDGSFAQVNPPTLSATLSVPTSIASGATFTASTTLTNTGGIRAHGVSASLSLPSGFTIISGSNPQNLGSIDPGSVNSKSATWTVRAPTVSSAQTYSVSTSVSSSSYGDTYAASNSRTITVGAANVQTDYIGVFRPSAGTFFLDHQNNGWTSGDAVIPFGISVDKPSAGDWDNDGIDEIGVFRPAAGTFYLDYQNNGWTSGDAVIPFGISGDLPVAGDWDNDGVDEIGVFRPSAGTFFLDYQNNGWTSGDAVIPFGISGDLPVAGDWDKDGIDEIGVFRPSAGTFFLDYQNNGWTTGDAVIPFGITGDQPVAGCWSMTQSNSVTVPITVKRANSGSAVPNALVTVQDGAGNTKQATTDGAGQATITGISGTWQISVSASGYITNSGTYQIPPPPASTSVTIYLQVV